MKELLETVAKGLVDAPDAVEVTVDEPNEEGVTVYHLHVGENETIKNFLLAIIFYSSAISASSSSLNS